MNAITNDIRSFVFKLQHAVSSADFVAKFGKYSNGPLELWNLVSNILNSPSEPLHYEMHSLKEKVALLKEPHAKIKDCWNSLVMCLPAKDPDWIREGYEDLIAAFPPFENLGEFCDTDLILYEDHEVRPMRMNGIRKTEFQYARQLYRDFYKKLTFDTSKCSDLKQDEFKKRVLQDLRILMSRPLGRELIAKILSSKFFTEVKIKAGNYSYCRQISILSFEFEIELMIDSDLDFCAIPKHGFRSFFAPRFVVLFHELVHLQHRLEISAYHSLTDFVKPDDVDSEEFRAIKGFCKCHGFDPLNEESFRKQFGLPLRFLPLKEGGNSNLSDAEEPPSKRRRIQVISPPSQTHLPQTPKNPVLSTRECL